MGLSVSILLTCFIYPTDGAGCPYIYYYKHVLFIYPQMALSVAPLTPLEYVVVIYLVLPLMDGSHVLKPLQTDGVSMMLLLIPAVPRAACNHDNGYQGYRSWIL